MFEDYYYVDLCFDYISSILLKDDVKRNKLEKTVSEIFHLSQFCYINIEHFEEYTIPYSNIDKYINKNNLKIHFVVKENRDYYVSVNEEIYTSIKLLRVSLYGGCYKSLYITKKLNGDLVNFGTVFDNFRFYDHGGLYNISVYINNNEHYKEYKNTSIYSDLIVFTDMETKLKYILKNYKLHLLDDVDQMIAGNIFHIIVMLTDNYLALK